MPVLFLYFYSVCCIVSVFYWRIYRCCTVSVFYSRINASLVSCKSQVTPKASKGKAKTEILLSAPVNGGRLFVVKFLLYFILYLYYSDYFILVFQLMGLLSSNLFVCPKRKTVKKNPNWNRYLEVICGNLDWPHYSPGKGGGLGCLRGEFF